MPESRSGFRDPENSIRRYARHARAPWTDSGRRRGGWDGGERGWTSIIARTWNVSKIVASIEPTRGGTTWERFDNGRSRWQIFFNKRIRLITIDNGAKNGRVKVALRGGSRRIPFARVVSPCVNRASASPSAQTRAHSHSRFIRGLINNETNAVSAACPESRAEWMELGDGGGAVCYAPSRLGKLVLRVTGFPRVTQQCHVSQQPEESHHRETRHLYLGFHHPWDRDLWKCWIKEVRDIGCSSMRNWGDFSWDNRFFFHPAWIYTCAWRR